MSVDDVTLDILVTCTDGVADAIRVGDWQRASELEAERRRLLERFTAAEIRACGGITHLRDEFETLISGNNRLIGELHHERRRILREASTVKRGRTAVAEYGHQDHDGAERTLNKR